MRTTESTVVLQLTPEEHEDRKRLIDEYLHEKFCQGFQREGVAGSDPYKLPRFQFDANYNAYYCKLKFFRQ